MNNKLDVIEKNCLRCIYEVTWNNRVRTLEFKARTGVGEKISD